MSLKPSILLMNEEDKRRAEEERKIKDPAVFFFTRFPLVFHPQGFEETRKLHVEPDDIFVITPPKCGTTLTLMVVHQLRSGGDFSFEDLDIVCPFLEAAYGAGVDIHQPQKFTPRVFKTHLLWSVLPQGGKKIFVARDPCDAGISYYHFMKNWIFSEYDNVTLDFFMWNIYKKFSEIVSATDHFASIWHQYAETFNKRNDPDFLWIHYENMIQDREEVIRLIANFLGISISDSDFFNMVKERSSISFMKMYPEKFDMHVHKRARNPFIRLPLDAGTDHNNNSGLVRMGKPGEGKNLSLETQKIFDKIWTNICEPVTGCKNYNEMRLLINKELGRNFKSNNEN